MTDQGKKCAKRLLEREILERSAHNNTENGLYEVKKRKNASCEPFFGAFCGFQTGMAV